MIPALALLLGSTAMVGCKQNNTPAQKETKATSIVIRNNKDVVYLNDLDPEHPMTLSAVVKPDDARNKEVRWSSSDTNVAEIDSSTGVVTFKNTGTVTFTCTSVDVSTVKQSVTTQVKADYAQDLVFSTIVEPVFVDEYNQNTATLDSVANIQTNKDPLRTTYYAYNEDDPTAAHRDMYRVGNQNAFKYDVKATFSDPDTGNTRDIDSPKLAFSFEKYNTTSGEYEPISKEAESQHVTLADNQKSMTFKSGVTGQYKIKVDADRTYYPNVDEHLQQFEFEVEVVDGVNVYTAKELSAFDNMPKVTNQPGDNSTYFDAIKQEVGLAGIDAKGIVLQADINITRADLPDEYFVTQEAVNSYKNTQDFEDYATARGISKADLEELLVGSMYDCVAVYGRHTNASTDFNFEGNYFTVDASRLKQVYAFWTRLYEKLEEGTLPGYEYTHDTNGSHSELFAINSDSRNNTPEARVGWAECTGGQVAFKNATFIGNGDRSEDDKYLGGLIGFKIEGVVSRFENILSSKTFMTFMSNRRTETSGDGVFTTEMHMDRCKNFDSYNCLVYLWGSDHNTVTNSFMKGAGGAIFLLDEPGAGSVGGNHWVPEVDCENVYFENKVTGTEAWFSGHNATQEVDKFKRVGNDTGWVGHNAKDTNGKTFVSEDAQEVKYVNIIALDICADAVFDNTANALKGHISINNGADPRKSFSLNMNDLSNNPVLAGLAAQMQDQPLAMLFGSNTGYGALIDPVNFADGIMYDALPELMADTSFTDLCHSLEDDFYLGGFADVMSTNLAQLQILPTYSKPTGIPTSLSTLEEDMPGLVEAGIENKISEDTGGTIKTLEGFAGYLAQQQSITDPDQVAAFVQQYCTGVRGIISQLTTKAVAKVASARQGFNASNYLGMYLKPAAGAHYIGGMLGME